MDGRAPELVERLVGTWVFRVLGAVGGYAEFAANKVAWNLGDGMFWAWGEGPDASSVVPRHGPLTAWVVSWSHPSGDLYEIRAGLV